MPDFTEAETHSYLGKANEWRQAQNIPMFSVDENVEDVIARLGGRPAHLHDLTTNSLPVGQFIEESIAGEKRRIRSLLNADAKYAPVLRQLLPTESMLNDITLMDMLGEPIEKIAATTMAKYHVLSYNPVKGVLQFHSKATAEAAKQWAKEEANKW